MSRSIRMTDENQPSKIQKCMDARYYGLTEDEQLIGLLKAEFPVNDCWIDTDSEDGDKTICKKDDMICKMVKGEFLKDPSVRRALVEVITLRSRAITRRRDSSRPSSLSEKMDDHADINRENEEERTVAVCLDAPAVTDVVLKIITTFDEAKAIDLRGVAGLTDDKILKALLETPADMLDNREFYAAQHRICPKSFAITVVEALVRCVSCKDHNVLHRLTFDAPYDMIVTSDFSALKSALDYFDDRGPLGHAIRVSKDVTCPIEQDTRIMSRMANFNLGNLRRRQKNKDVCPTIEMFKKKFAKKSLDVLDDEFFARFGDHVVAAGGSIAECLQDDVYVENNDIDLFIHGIKDVASAARLVEDVVQYVLRKINSIESTSLPSWDNPRKNVIVDVTNNSTNITLYNLRYEFPEVHMEIQIVMRLFGSIQQLLVYFDHGACRFGFDGRNVHVTASALFAQKNRMFFLEPAMQSYSRRLLKYFLRDFTPLVPVTKGYELCVSHVFGKHQDDEELRHMLQWKTLASILAYRKLRSRDYLQWLNRERNNTTTLNSIDDYPLKNGDPEQAKTSDMSGSQGRDMQFMMNISAKGQSSDYYRDKWYNTRCTKRDILWNAYPNICNPDPELAFTYDVYPEFVVSNTTGHVTVGDVFHHVRDDVWRWKVDKPMVNLVGSGINFFQISDN